MPVIAFEQHTPVIDQSCFVAPDAWVIGEVKVAKSCSIFFGAVLRGDINPIEVGEGTNIQEHCLLHTSHGLGPCTVGKNVTVGHRAILHGCTVEDECIIGMGSIILDGTTVGKNCIVGAGSVLPMNKTYPANSLILGSPAKVVRPLTSDDLVAIKNSYTSYIHTSSILKKELS